MRSKFFVILAIIALVGFVVSIDHECGWAQQEEEEALEQEGPPEPFEESKDPLPAEYTSNLDADAAAGAPAPEQDLYTDLPRANPPLPPPGGGVPVNSFQYTGTDEVDALANRKDLLFSPLVQNIATLLVSFSGDPGGTAVWYENPAGGTGAQWSQLNFDTRGIVPNPARELDAFELWGPSGRDDANDLSLFADPVGGTPARRVSVWYYNGTTRTPFIDHSLIVAACTSPALDTLPGLGHYVGNTELIDLDALMVREIGPGTYGEWDTNDTLIFSIRNTIAGGGNWDGGEIVVLPFGGNPSYLNHGGHRWCTTFLVAGTFGVGTEEVDAIEAYYYRAPQTPTVTQWGLVILIALLIASTVFIMLRRRKTAVPV